VNKTSKTRQVLSGKTLGNIGVRFEAPTRQYLKAVIPGNRCIAVICIGSHTTASWKPYKLTAVLKLQDADCVATVQFCMWFYETLYSGDVNPILTYVFYR
jgi:hypothetical protein